MGMCSCIKKLAYAIICEIRVLKVFEIPASMTSLHCNSRDDLLWTTTFSSIVNVYHGHKGPYSECECDSASSAL